MYNYSLNLTYRDFPDDAQYRKELLQVFGLTSYDSELTRKIEKLYFLHPHYFDEAIHYLQETSSLSYLLEGKEDCFLLLFTYSNFLETHRYLGEILSKGDNIAVKKQHLLDHLKRNNIRL